MYSNWIWDNWDKKGFCSNSNNKDCPNYKREIDVIFLIPYNEKLLCGSCHGDILYQIERNKTNRWLNGVVDQALASHEIKRTK